MLSGAHLGRELDDFRPGVMMTVLHTSRSVVEHGEEGVHPKHSDDLDATGDIDKPVDKLELARLFTNDRGTRRENPLKHNATTPRFRKIRQGSGTSIAVDNKGLVNHSFDERLVA